MVLLVIAEAAVEAIIWVVKKIMDAALVVVSAAQALLKVGLYSAYIPKPNLSTSMTVMAVNHFKDAWNWR
jgi:hypothetical protein